MSLKHAKSVEGQLVLKIKILEREKGVDNHIDIEENIPEEIENKESPQMEDTNEIN